LFCNKCTLVALGVSYLARFSIKYPPLPSLIYLLLPSEYVYHLP
jgi:hypothetical protein